MPPPLLLPLLASLLRSAERFFITVLETHYESGEGDVNAQRERR